MKSSSFCLIAITFLNAISLSSPNAKSDSDGDSLITPAEYLASIPKPVFRTDHRLPPLTRYGWTLPIDTRIALARDWGYALEFGGYVTERSVAKLDDPESTESRIVKLAASDPNTYKLSVICSRRLPTEEAPVETWTRDENGRLLNGKAESLDGTRWHEGMRAIYSPTAPDEVWRLAGTYRAEPIRAVRARCPIAIVLNGGEYGLGVLGFAQKVWGKDPRVLAAKGETPWYDYISNRKARAETLIADEVKRVVPNRQLYIYYTTGGGTHRNRHSGWANWMYDYKSMKPVSDLASSEHYYMHFNSGWTGNNDMLTQALNARGYEIALGQPLCYDWLCAGWPRDKGLGSDKELDDGGLGDLTRYTGFLKCLYITGMVGGNAGYYAYPKGGFATPFPADAPPHWLRQMVAFSRVHALFSHLESYIRQGELLPGPDPHAWSKDQPAYELSTGDKTVRVVARAHKTQPVCLVAAWAAAGDARNVQVDLPQFGSVTLNARPGGSVYLVEKEGEKIVPKLLDTNETMPSSMFARR